MTGFMGKANRRVHDDGVGAAAQDERMDAGGKLPGEIVSFDPATQTATVKVMYKPRINGEPVTPPELLEVPVIQPRGGGFAFTLPLGKGDPVEISFEDRDTSEYHETGKQSPANSARMNSMSDAVAKPGRFPNPKKHTNYDDKNAFIGTDDHKNGLRVSPDGKSSLEGNGENMHQIIHDALQVLIDSVDVEGPGFTPGVRSGLSAIQARLGKMKL